MNEQYHPEHAKKQKVRLPLSAYLSYLLVATVLFTGVSFSKFASSGSAGDDARVAVVVVDGGSYEEGDVALSLGGDGETTAEYSFYLTNVDDYGQISEVSLDYTVSVTMPEGRSLPEGVKASLTYYYDVYDDEGNYLAEECTAADYEDNGIYTFDGGADFVAGEWGQHEYTLTFTMIDASLVTDDYDFTGIEISVKAEQID